MFWSQQAEHGAYRADVEHVYGRPRLFTGRFPLTLDSQNRLSIPAGVRAVVSEEEDNKHFYVTPGTRKNTLMLFTVGGFKQYTEKMRASLGSTEEADTFATVFYSMTTLLELDKQGRVVIPQYILDQVSIGNNLIMSGKWDHLMIWNQAEFEAFVKEYYGRCQDQRKIAELKEELNRRNGGPASPAASF